MRQREHLDGGVRRHLHRSRINWIIAGIRREIAAGDRPRRLLDVGCGDGVLTRRLEDALPGVEMSAVDFDAAPVGCAEGYCARTRFVQADVAALPCSDGVFDIVLCHHVVEHVDDDRGLLAECSRVLASKGLFILGIPQEDSLPDRMVRVLHRGCTREASTSTSTRSPR